MIRPLIALGLAIPILGACAEGRAVRNDEYRDDSRRAQVAGRLGAGDGLLVFGVDHTRAAGGAGDPGGTGGGLGVNAFLWRATLDTLSFMPLASADPYGGVIITDWYINPEKPDERFKCTVYILDARLRADGLNVSVFKQVRDAAGNWVDAPTAAQTETDLEN
ncbi:MAG TPA: DUF3576 domain-containing protein, partial [Acetobacteraceae bacterium]|nr:DUF3576 domain-containing protein [Acetobacteraceae bacterium]